MRPNLFWNFGSYDPKKGVFVPQYLGAKQKRDNGLAAVVEWKCKSAKLWYET
jgi:hypothetical protein